jgi:hypothetical protein
MAGVLGVIWGSGEAEYFYGADWTKPCVICPTGNATGSSFRQRDLHHGITSRRFFILPPITVLAEDACAGAAAMNAIAAPKSSALNRLEGFALTAILQGFPSFAAAALLLKLAHHEIAGGVGVVRRDGLGASTACSRPGSRQSFQNSSGTATSRCSSTPGLSFAEKIAKWRERPTTSVQLVTSELMLALLAVAVVSMR